MTTDRVLAQIVPEAPRLYLDSLSSLSLPADMPRFYVKLIDDNSADPKQQDGIIRRLRPYERVIFQCPHGHPS